MSRYYLIFALVLLLAIGLATSAQDSTPTRTPYPTPLPTITPMATLPRYPTNEQIYSYLLYNTVRQYVLDLDYRDPYGWVLDAESIYQDVNGDTVDDLIVAGRLGVAVILWQGDHYGEPFELSRSATRFPAWRTFLEDWTFDGVPEIVFDVNIPYSGTGLWGSYWQRTVIYCDASCRVAWTGTLEDYEARYDYDGFGLKQISIERVQLDNGRIELHTRETGLHFNLYCSDCDNQYYAYPIRESHFEWTGSFFARLAVNEVEPRTYLAFEARYAANTDSYNAEIQLDDVIPPDTIHAYHRTTCTLTINEHQIGSPTLCNPRFTDIYWQDITGDGQDDIITSTVMTFVGNDDIDCIQQRLRAYSLVGNQISEIADVTGCITNPNLFGVQLEDVDGDGQTEIIAAADIYIGRCGVDTNTYELPACWYELNKQDEIYRWNGEHFEYDRTVPRD